MPKFDLKCPVPMEQRPENEYKLLKKSPSFAWTTKNNSIFIKNVIILLCIAYTFSSIIFCNSYRLDQNARQLIVYIPTFGNMLFSLNVLRCYLGWQYVYKRLLQATVIYEESGWYDGQIWIKPKEILAQDRLIGTYELFPILTRLKLVIYASILTTLIYIYINYFIFK